MTLGGNLKKSTTVFPSKQLMNKRIQVSLSFVPILWHALENKIKCALIEIVPFPENFDQWYLNFWRGFSIGEIFKGEDTCHGVLVASSSNWKKKKKNKQTKTKKKTKKTKQNKTNFLITLAGLVVDWTETWWLKILPIMDDEELREDLDDIVPEEDPEDVILKEMGIKDTNELDESDRDFQCIVCGLPKKTFLLPISNTWLISGDKPLILWEKRDP